MKTFLLFCMTFWIGMANASLIEINAQDAGWYNQLGLHTNDNQNSMNAINSLDGLFAIGGSFATNFTNSYIFGASENIDQMKLILNTTSIPVPQPAGLTLLVIGLFSIGFCRKIKT